MLGFCGQLVDQKSLKVNWLSNFESNGNVISWSKDFNRLENVLTMWPNLQVYIGDYNYEKYFHNAD
jgi:hypothetical protein